ncbi:MAG: T9SS type A sorting domain-containing protein [Fibrobacter sp.]|mgnify:CR=1 FL=1|nr:T9SS type A sorting domain-containing protein [Fibrobacter sp.]
MKRYFLLVAISVLLFAESGLTQNLSIQVAGVKRSCILHVPAEISSPAVVFVLHGMGGDGAGMQNSTQMDKVADRENFIVAYPSAVGGKWDYASTKNDYTFIKDLIDTLDARYKIDRNKVYVTGFSQGGGMAVYIGFQYPEIFAAIAPTSSIGSGAPAPKKPIPIFLTFGTNDMYPVATFMSAVSSWLEIDSCPSAAVFERPYPLSNTRSVVTRLSFGPCAQGTEVVVDSIAGGGHEWPMNTTTKVNNSEEVWAFFQKFSLDRTTGNLPSNKPARKPLVAKYRSGIIQFESGGLENSIHITDASGRSVCTAVTKNGQIAFKRDPGLYIVRVGDKRGIRTVKMVVPE